MDMDGGLVKYIWPFSGKLGFKEDKVNQIQKHKSFPKSLVSEYFSNFSLR